jgi:hypothetical protein
MKRFRVLALIFLSASIAKAQINAITETGYEVILYPDGTWIYVNDSIETGREIIVNKQEFAKDKKASFLVKSKKVNIGIWINPKEWQFSKSSDNEDAEYQFKNKKNDIYGILISEKVQIQVETLRDIAIENAKKVAPDIHVAKEEYRYVNGIKVLMLQMSGTIKGMKFGYYGYYYSNEEGTIQFLTYTGESIINNYLKEIETFLNGLTEL